MNRATEIPVARAAARWIPAFACPATLRSNGRALAGRVTELSDHGARIELDGVALGLDPAAPVALTFGLGPTPAERAARLVWLHEADGVTLAGLHFALIAPGASGAPLVVDLAAVTIDPREALRIPISVALRRRVLPLCILDGHVVTACGDLSDPSGIEAVERAFQRPVRPQPVDPHQLGQTIVRVHGDPRLATQQEPDRTNVFEQIMYSAWLRRASDVHVCPEADGVHVLFRVDGELESHRVLPRDAHSELLSRIKVLAGMDIAEKRAPQDGRFTQPLPGDRHVDIRVATLPTNHGERATLRLLAIDAETLTLENLGMSAADLERCSRNLKRPHGMILATGPTGCGKTTTLYAALRMIRASRSVNLIALQEPVEYDIPGITQVEIDSQKISFASALRSIMRHDPDVIMIGEIRDAETADIAIKAALTGHLVLATLHTNSAASAITRLVDMGVERYLIAATLRLVVAQRLVRRLCALCRRARPMHPELARLLGHRESAGAPVFDPHGCVFCAGRGFLGRLGLFEILELDDEIAESIRAGGQERELETIGRRKGMQTLRDDALAKLLAGASAPHPILEVIEAAETTDA